ncbi:MAG: excisionase family DNA-binding protein [Candidatus Hydrogenedentes bacterium]|nr:excisionase family DNA-binding protein [Candidatus Hydrogenedentota bacterium]
MEKPLTKKEAAEYYSIHYKTFEKLVNKFQITYHLCGKRKRFYKSDLDAYLHKNRRIAIDT